METNEVLTAITTVGFPVVMCLILTWYIYYLTNRHQEEMDKVINAVQNNTIAVNKLCEKLEE